jgi:hypothetical protein
MNILIIGPLHPPAISSLLGTNILLSTLFPKTLDLCSFISVRDQVLHSYKRRWNQSRLRIGLSHKQMAYTKTSTSTSTSTPFIWNTTENITSTSTTEMSHYVTNF